MTSIRSRQPDSDTDSDALRSSPLLPVALRQGFSLGQGVAAVVMAVGVFLLLGSDTGVQPLGVVLLTAGIVALAAVETVRVTRRRRALLRAH